jgi:metal-sulfur cluster biosynthetic enzyme
MALTEEQIREALKQVVDPELFVNIIDLGLVYTVTVAPAKGDAHSLTTNVDGAITPDHQTPAHQTPDTRPPTDQTTATATTESGEATTKEDVFIEMTMTSPACPAAPQLITGAKQAVGRLPGVSNVEVKIVMTPPWTPDLMTDEARDQLGIF